MSDLANPLNIFDFLGISQLQAFKSIISDAFFADYGIVTAVHDQKTVDVKHAVLSVTRPGIVAEARVLDALVTTGVEILWTSMGGLAITGTVKNGDPVLLIGLRDLLPSTQGLTAPAQPPEFWHYAQQTMKAIPMSGMTTADVEFGELNGKAFLRNRAKSLYTLLNTFEQATATFMGPASQASITAGGASSAALASAMVALMASFTTATSTMLADLAALLEA